MVRKLFNIFDGPDFRLLCLNYPFSFYLLDYKYVEAETISLTLFHIPLRSVIFNIPCM